MFGCKPCTPSDPATDTVKASDIQAQVAERERLFAEEQRRQQEAEEEQRRVQEQERRRAEEAARAQKELQERQEAEARRMQEEQQRRAAELARQRQREQEEEARRVEEARRREEEEIQRLERERIEEQERKATVAAFLKEYGFASVTVPRKKLTKTSYALHKAAKLGDCRLCEMLIAEGADSSKKDSRGKTPGQVAQAKNSKGSHAPVMELLGHQSKPTVGGA